MNLEMWMASVGAEAVRAAGAGLVVGFLAAVLLGGPMRRMRMYWREFSRWLAWREEQLRREQSARAAEARTEELREVERVCGRPHGPRAERARAEAARAEAPIVLSAPKKPGRTPAPRVRVPAPPAPRVPPVDDALDAPTTAWIKADGPTAVVHLDVRSLRERLQEGRA